MSFWAVECADGYTPSTVDGGIVCIDGQSTAPLAFQQLDLAVVATTPGAEIDPASATTVLMAGLGIGVALYGTVFAIRIILKLILSSN